MTDCFCDTATAKSSLALDQEAAQISNIYNTGIISSSNDFDITDVAFSTFLLGQLRWPNGIERLSLEL